MLGRRHGDVLGAEVALELRSAEGSLQKKSGQQSGGMRDVNCRGPGPNRGACGGMKEDIQRKPS